MLNIPTSEQDAVITLALCDALGLEVDVSGATSATPASIATALANDQIQIDLPVRISTSTSNALIRRGLAVARGDGLELTNRGRACAINCVLNRNRAIV